MSIGRDVWTRSIKAWVGTINNTGVLGWQPHKDTLFSDGSKDMPLALLTNRMYSDLSKAVADAVAARTLFQKLSRPFLEAEVCYL